MIYTYGPHKLSNGSLMGQQVDDMVAGEKVNILYSDPPWGEGNMKYWVTLAKKQTGEGFDQTTYASLLARIADLTNRYVDGYVFIETGLKWGAQVCDALSLTVHNLKTHRMSYNSGQPCLLIEGVTNPALPSITVDVTNLHGAALPKAVIGNVATPGGLVLDPCCGMGYTARATVAAGMRFRGNEVNKHRMQDTIKVLKKSAGIA